MPPCSKLMLCPAKYVREGVQDDVAATRKGTNDKRKDKEHPKAAAPAHLPPARYHVVSTWQKC